MPDGRPFHTQSVETGARPIEHHGVANRRCNPHPSGCAASVYRSESLPWDACSQAPDEALIRSGRSTDARNKLAKRFGANQKGGAMEQNILRGTADCIQNEVSAVRADESRNTLDQSDSA